MGKNKRKRSKKYTGEDAVRQAPVVHRYSAVERSKFGQWWQDNKVSVLMRLAQIGIVALVALVFYLIYLLLVWIF
ncbi:hypothetical protein DYH10_03680 [Candidatus Saccharibacteria bacterium CPR2]|nr:hypothetical protein [Candidatus Saccharibacteria bacterium CPR2]